MNVANALPILYYWSIALYYKQILHVRLTHCNLKFVPFYEKRIIPYESDA